MLPITRVLNLQDKIYIYRLFQIYLFSFEKYISGNMIAEVLRQNVRNFFYHLAILLSSVYAPFLIKNSSYACNDWSKVLQNMYVGQRWKNWCVSSFSTFLLPFSIARLIIWFTVDFPNLCPLSIIKKKKDGQEQNETKIIG